MCVCGVCVCVCFFVRLGVVAWVRLIRIVIDGSYSLQQFSLEQSLNVRGGCMVFDVYSQADRKNKYGEFTLTGRV